MSSAALGLCKPQRTLDFKANYHFAGVFQLAPCLSASDAREGGPAAILYIEKWVQCLQIITPQASVGVTVFNQLMTPPACLQFETGLQLLRVS